ncbi:MAG: GNAT family N-acetyltransferase [Ardenticatenaceae bacterium]|nr:GNAT family N-acetyltransferase [Ardenticatenaceae bacterium]MCB9443198.1 GNAT family N-acetyltransferase [Ardenticatenaceae bacterium]
MTTNIFSRPAASEADYWAVYRLLVDTVRPLPLGLNWDVRRWEGRRFYNENPTGNPDWAEGVQLWETEQSQVVGAVIAVHPGWADLQLHPNHHHLVSEMLDWAEANAAGPTDSGDGSQLHIGAFAYDGGRQALLAQRGYEQMTYGWVIRHLRFDTCTLAQPNLADGYTLRTTNPENVADSQRIADLLNAAFGRAFHTAAEYQWFTRKAPSFRQYLDLVAVAPDGTFAAYVGVPFDDVNQRGIFEPVCTHPDHQRKGLAKALMQEALLRLELMGAVDVTVETGDRIPANALYNSLGFTQTEKGYYWRKLL